LVDFYISTQGDYWQISHNWLIGDPCVNLWYGIGCDIDHHIVSIHFFENHLTGIFPPSFVNLIWLKHLSIFNDARYYENLDVYHRNTIYVWDNKIMSKLWSLEEINLCNLDMWGRINEDFVKNMTNLRFLNIAANKFNESLPNIPEWANIKHL